MAALFVDQKQLKADADVLLPWVMEQMNSPFNLIPDSVKIIIERWIPVFQGLADSDKLRESVAAWINNCTGAT